MWQALFCLSTAGLLRLPLLLLLHLPAKGSLQPSLFQLLCDIYTHSLIFFNTEQTSRAFTITGYNKTEQKDKTSAMTSYIYKWDHFHVWLPASRDKDQFPHHLIYHHALQSKPNPLWESIPNACPLSFHVLKCTS